MSRHNVHEGKVSLGRNMRKIIKEAGGLMTLDELMGALRSMGINPNYLRGFIIAGSMRAYITVNRAGEVWATGTRRGN